MSSPGHQRSKELAIKCDLTPHTQPMSAASRSIFLYPEGGLREKLILLRQTIKLIWILRGDVLTRDAREMRLRCA